MIRILIFFLVIVLIAGAVTVLATFDSRITGEAFGYNFDGPSGLILGGLLVAFLAVIYLTHKIKEIMGLPARLHARDAAKKRERGVAALTRGLEAVAVGDAADASHHARVAERHLEDKALTRLLSAQAAHLAGDEEAARRSFAAMLEAPETEFMGLKGLYAQAMARGDHDLAREHAERAFALRANAGWAFESVVDLGLERGAWGDVRDAIDKGRRNKLIAPDKADRATAALHTAEAYGSHLAGDHDEAKKRIDAALKLAPALAPAASLAARMARDEDKTGRAARILETAFATDPHPALIRLYDNLYKDEQPEKRAEKLRKLAQKNSDSTEAALLEARAANLVGDWSSAMTRLEPVLTRSTNAYGLALMADAASGLHGPEAGKAWLQRAAAAPRDPRPGADGTFHFNRAGWARLVREYMEHGRLSPPPLEDAEAISSEELRLLTAPPAIEDALPPDDETGDSAPVIEGDMDDHDAQAEVGKDKERAPETEEDASGEKAEPDNADEEARDQDEKSDGQSDNKREGESADESERNAAPARSVS